MTQVNREKEKIESIVSARRMGLTYQEIAQDFRVSRQRIYQIIKKYGVVKGEVEPDRFVTIHCLVLKRIEDAQMNDFHHEYLNALLDVNKLFASVDPLAKLLK